MSLDAKTNTIWTFDGTEHDFLSNFHPAPILHAGKAWATSEHAYQAAKTLCIVEGEAIRLAAGPGTAKIMGQRVAMREDWDKIKYKIMLDIVRAKFAQSPIMAELLLKTNDAYLEEGNTWNDRIWGIYPPRSGKGENWLGIILMHARKELPTLRRCK